MKRRFCITNPHYFYFTKVLYHFLSKKSAVNQNTGEKTTTIRKRLKVDFGIPMKEQYSDFIKGFLAD